jgi:membrane protease YdiL (CAAX protease family)
VELWNDFLANARAYLVIAGIGVVLAIIGFFCGPRQVRRPLPPPRLRRGRWGGFEVAMAFLYQQFVPILVIGMLDSLGFFESWLGEQPSAERRLILSAPLSVALTLALILSLLFAVSRTRPHSFGLVGSRWPANLVLGVLAFLVLAPVVLGVYYLTVLVLPGKEEHALEQLVKGRFRDWEWYFLVFHTAVAAPLLEELLFRGLLLGWLRRASLAGHLMVAMFTVYLGAQPLGLLLAEADTTIPLAAAVSQLVFAGLMAAAYVGWLVALRRRLGATAPPEPVADADTEFDDATPPEDFAAYLRSRRRDEKLAYRADAPWRRLNGSLAIYGSAMLFAASHNVWPTPVPLLLLGLGLGWLASRTQSLVGPIVCHALFNGVACLVLYWEATART